MIIKDYYTGDDAATSWPPNYGSTPRMSLNNFTPNLGVNDQYKFSMGDKSSPAGGCYPLPAGSLSCTNCCPQNEINQVPFYIDLDWENEYPTNNYASC